MNLPDYKQYRIDINGDSPENRVVEEVIKRTTIGDGDILVPRHAPFFHESLSLTHLDGSPLYRGEDYDLIDIDERWVWKTAEPVGIFIRLLKPEIKQVIADYQTIGTCPLFNRNIAMLTGLAVDDDRDVWWEDIEGKPKIFPLKLHNHDINVDIYAVELLSETLQQRFEMFYLNKDKSIHEDFFLGQLKNLRSYFPLVKAELKDRSDKHTQNIWNAHLIRGKDIEGLENVENVRTATLKETMELKDERLRLAVNPTYRTIAKEGVNTDAAVDITGVDLNYKKTVYPTRSIVNERLDTVGFKTYSSGFFLGNDGKGYGLAMGNDGVTEGVTILMNHNPFSELNNPFINEWVNSHIIVDGVNAVIRGSNGDGMILGDYRKQQWYYVRPNGSIHKQNQTWVTLKLPSGDVFDLDFVREALFVPVGDHGYLLRQRKEYSFNKFDVWYVDASGIIRPQVTATPVEGAVNSGTGVFTLFNFDYDFEGKCTGGLIKLNGKVKYNANSVGCSAFSFPSNDANGDYVKLLMHERWGTEEDGIDVSSKVILRFKRNGNNLTIKTEDWSNQKLDVKLMGKPFTHPNLSGYPMGFCGNGVSLSDFGSGWSVLMSRDENENFVCVTTFKESLFYPQVYDVNTFKENKVFKPNGDDFKTNDDGLLSIRKYRKLNMSTWYDAGDRIGGYSESEFMGGSVIFKSVDTSGNYRHHMKRVGSRILARNLKDETVWMRDPSNFTIPLPFIQQNQITVSVNDLTDPALFGNTWFNAVSKANRLYDNTMRVGIASYLINDINEMVVSSFYAVQESFVERVLGEPLKENMFWTIMFSNDRNIVAHHMLIVHYLENGKMRSVIKQFDFNQERLATTTVDGTKSYLFNDKTPYTLFATHPYNNVNFNEKGIESNKFITDYEGFESGKFIIRKDAQGMTMIYVSSGFVQEKGWFRPNPVVTMIRFNPYQAITNVDPMGYYDEDHGLYYIKSLGWHVTTGDVDNLLGGGCLPSLSIPNDVMALQTAQSNSDVPVSPVDRLPVKDWTLYIPRHFLLTHKGRNFIVTPTYLALKDYLKEYKSKQFFVYINVLSGKPEYEFREQLINHPDRFLLCRVLTNDTGIKEIENY